MCLSMSSYGLNDVCSVRYILIKEIKLLRGDVACYVAQARAPIDAETCPPLAGWAKRPFVDGN